MPKPIRILAYDATPHKLLDVATIWVLGAFFFRPLFAHVIAAKSWYDVLDKCRAVGGNVELHYWGHGRPGQAFIGEQVLPRRDKRWRYVGLLWLRCCSTMAGVGGVALVNDLSRHGTAVAGQLCIIGGSGHSYLVGTTADKPVWWPLTAVDAAIWSRPWYPRTVSALRQRLPKWWNRPDKKELTL